MQHNSDVWRRPWLCYNNHDEQCKGLPPDLEVKTRIWQIRITCTCLHIYWLPKIIHFKGYRRKDGLCVAMRCPFSVWLLYSSKNLTSQTCGVSLSLKRWRESWLGSVASLAIAGPLNLKKSWIPCRWAEVCWKLGLFLVEEKSFGGF